MVNTYCDYYLYGMTKADYIEITDKGYPLLALRTLFPKELKLYNPNLPDDGKRKKTSCSGPYSMSLFFKVHFPNQKRIA